MKRTILAAAVAVVLADAAPARAQFGCGPVRPPAFGGFGFGGGFGYYSRGFGFGFGGYKHKFGFAGFGGGFYSRSVFFGPPVWPILPPVAPLTPFGFGPGFLGPGWGVGPAGFGWNPWWGGWWGPPVVPPPVIVVPPIVLAGNGRADRDADVVAGGPVRRPAADPAPAAPVGNFLVIEPRKNLPAPAAVVPVAALPLLPPPAGRPDPFADPVPVKIARPDPDPAREAARLLKLGREAFAAGEYGRAAEQFGRAAGADPKAAGPHFLRAQAALAAGGYADAVAAVRAGLELDPAWPAGAFDPKEPYGAGAAAFAVHLADLRKAVAGNPGEPALEFLLGYQLWFVGEKAEAKKWFAAAAARLPAPGPIALFK